MNIVAGSMRDAFGTQKDLRLSGIVEVDGIPTKPRLKHAYVRPVEDASDMTAPNDHKRKDDGLSSPIFDRGFALAAASLRQALQDLPEVTEMSKNVMIEQTKDGLAISIVDQDGRSMFAEGSAQPYERARLLIEKMAPTLRRMPNRVTITGHTSARRPGAGRFGASPWDLSVNRASAVREILVGAGLMEERIVAITGKADTEPMFPDNPYLAANRRVTITMMHEAPPLPVGVKP
jgi:chemotaxis protein MotB